jgi:hypothetical protein
MQEAYRKAVLTILASGKYDRRTKDLQEGVTVTQAWRDGMSALGKEESGAEQEKQAAEKIGKKLNEMARGSSSGSGERWTFFTVYEMAFPMDDPCGIKDATSSSQMIDSGQPQGGVTLADLRGDKTRALEEYERLILIGPQRLVRGENDTEVPEGYYELGEGAPFPIEGAKDPDRVAVHVVELYDFEKMSLVREDEQPACDDWPEAVQMGLQVLWPAPLLLPPARQKVTRQPRQVDHQRQAERAKEQNKELRKQVRALEKDAAKAKMAKSKKPRTKKPRKEREYTDVQTSRQAHQEEQRRRREEQALQNARLR